MLSVQSLIEFLVKSIVDHPEDVRVTSRLEGQTSIYTVHVHSDDVGKVIGRQGRIAKSLRSIVLAAAHRKQERVSLEIEA